MSWRATAVALIILFTTGCVTSVSVGEDCYHDVCTDCSAANCDDGCCLAGRCVAPSSSDCGIGGSECVDCGEGGSCSDAGECLCGGQQCPDGEHCEEGECHCGAEPSCGDLGTCIADECRCGPSPGCELGQRCTGRECICDALSCPGCCWGGVTCQRVPSVDACGLGGEECLTCIMGETCETGECRCQGEEGCSAFQADSCTPAGECRCGGGPACPPGLECDRGRCRCTASSCRGCCEIDTCYEPSFERCGVDGQTCISCEIMGGDACDSRGICRCGTHPSCYPGECVQGSCR